MAKDMAFRLVEFKNRGGSMSFRVVGWKSGGRSGKVRIRENFGTKEQAEARRHDLEIERLGKRTFENLRATWLSKEQLAAAEAVMHRVPDPAELSRAVDFWLRQGKKLANPGSDNLGLDEAVERFKSWLAGSEALRPATKRNLHYRVSMFASEVGNLPLAEISPEIIDGWLARRKVSWTTKANDKRALSSFFAWCVARTQRFIAHNPAREVNVDTGGDQAAPEIYTLPEVARLLIAAKRFRNGRFLSFIVLQLFGGLRPTEALRFSHGQLKDGLLRMEGKQTKTGKPRTSDVDPVLSEWLKRCPDSPVSDPQKSKLLWSQLRAKAKLSRWIPDGLRHTAVSHYFRRCGSYGETSEWAGNSESIIKDHYQARTTAAETAAFWTMFPDRQQRAASRQAQPTVTVADFGTRQKVKVRRAA